MKNKKEEYPIPFYVRKPKLSFVIGIMCLIIFMIPLSFIFGWMDWLINIETWKTVYLAVWLSSFASFGVAIMVLVNGGISEYRIFSKKYKNFITRLRHIEWKYMLFGNLLVVGMFFFFILMIGLPTMKDYFSELEVKSGSCTVWRKGMRGPDIEYVVFKDSSGNDSEIEISNAQFNELSGPLISDSILELEHRCNYDVEVFYTPNLNKSVYIRPVSKAF